MSPSEAYERGWRQGVQAYWEACQKAARVRPEYKGLAPRDPPSPQDPIGDAQGFSGFLAGWYRAEALVGSMLETLESGSP